MTFASLLRSISLISSGILAALAILLTPSDAFAWGPVAHLDFALEVLTASAAATPAIHALIRRFPLDFLHGSLAPDHVIAKNLARDITHCHSWSVGYRLLMEARDTDEQTEAFMLGYLSHLAADVVAHNFFVPRKVVSHSKARVGHLYWEARYDQKLLASRPDIRTVWKDLSAFRFREHEQFLARRLVPTLLSNELSTIIAKRGIDLQRYHPWRVAMNRVDQRSNKALTDQEVTLWRNRCVALIDKVYSKPSSLGLAELDPTGRSALAAAMRGRRELKRYLKRQGPDDTFLEMFRRIESVLPDPAGLPIRPAN